MKPIITYEEFKNATVQDKVNFVKKFNRERYERFFLLNDNTVKVVYEDREVRTLKYKWGDPALFTNWEDPLIYKDFCTREEYYEEIKQGNIPNMKWVGFVEGRLPYAYV